MTTDAANLDDDERARARAQAAFSSAIRFVVAGSAPAGGATVDRAAALAYAPYLQASWGVALVGLWAWSGTSTAATVLGGACIGAGTVGFAWATVAALAAASTLPAPRAGHAPLVAPSDAFAPFAGVEVACTPVSWEGVPSVPAHTARLPLAAEGAFAVWVAGPPSAALVEAGGAPAVLIVPSRARVPDAATWLAHAPGARCVGPADAVAAAPELPWSDAETALGGAVEVREVTHPLEGGTLAAYHRASGVVLGEALLANVAVDDLPLGFVDRARLRLSLCDGRPGPTPGWKLTQGDAARPDTAGWTPTALLPSVGRPVLEGAPEALRSAWAGLGRARSS
jgi:hypothetical protein